MCLQLDPLSCPNSTHVTNELRNQSVLKLIGRRWSGWFFFFKFDHFLVSFWYMWALKGRAKHGRAHYTGLAFCGFRVQVDEFNHRRAYRLLKHVSSHQFQRLSCVGLSTCCVFECELIELTELSENFVLVMVLSFPGGFFWWLTAVILWVRWIVPNCPLHIQQAVVLVQVLLWLHNIASGWSYLLFIVFLKY